MDVRALCTVDWPGFFDVVKDIALAGASVTTAGVAVIGLRKWQDELHGKANFDVARGLARATFGLREAIQSARSPIMRGIVVTPPGALRDRKVEFESLARAYRERWDLVAGALKEFDSEVLEAEALWGPEIRIECEKLSGCAFTLFVSIEAILDNERADGEHFAADKELGRRMRANAAASRNATDNSLSNEIAAAVSAIETKLRGHLSRKNARGGARG